MRSEAWTRLDRIFQQALDVPSAQRNAFVGQACGDDNGLRNEILSLLAANSRAAEGFLERPAVVLRQAGPEKANLKRATESAAPEAELGRRLGPYRLVELLGRGGMGYVYLGERVDDQVRQRVAIKVLRDDGRSDLYARFRTERQVLAGLVHPSIARLYDAGTIDDGRPFLVMELVEGEPLDVYCDRHRLSINARLRLFRQVCDAVQYAHRNLVVHRDLKPANILVTADGTPKLLDFGIAKLLDRERFDFTAAETRTGRRPMTPFYASPEQIEGDAITTATDTYALGVLLYRLLSGRSPYRLESRRVGELERAILSQEPVRPSAALALADDPTITELSRCRNTTPRELRRRLQGDLDVIALKALRKTPERRYRSAQELGDDLARHLADRPVHARPDTWRYQLGKFLHRHALTASASTVAILLLLAFSIVTALQSARITRQRDVAQQERDKAQQVSELLADLLQASNPLEVKKEDITVREVLDRGLEKIEQLADQPELQATYLNLMGRSYRSLGRYDTARPLLEEALAIRRRVHGDAHAEIAETLNDLGTLLQDSGDFQAAALLFRQALVMQRRLLPALHADLALPLNNLALVLHYQGDTESAEALYRESLDISHRRGDEDLGQFTAVSNLALLLHDRGAYEDAEPLYRQALALFRRLYGNDHPRVATTINNYAALLQDLGQYAAAEEMFQTALASRRKFFGEEHQAVVISLTSLGELRLEIGDLASAEMFFSDALELGRRILDPQHVRIASALAGLARAHLATGRAADAEEMLRQALTAYQARLPAGHYRILLTQSLLGGCLSELGRYREAEPLLLDSYPPLRAFVGEREPLTREALWRIVEHYERQGREDRAREYRAQYQALLTSVGARP